MYFVFYLFIAGMLEFYSHVVLESCELDVGRVFVYFFAL